MNRTYEDRLKTKIANQLYDMRTGHVNRADIMNILAEIDLDHKPFDSLKKAFMCSTVPFNRFEFDRLANDFAVRRSGKHFIGFWGYVMENMNNILDVSYQQAIADSIYHKLSDLNNHSIQYNDILCYICELGKNDYDLLSSDSTNIAFSNLAKFFEMLKLSYDKNKYSELHDELIEMYKNPDNEDTLNKWKFISSRLTTIL